MKTIIFGLVFLGYFQLFAFDCPKGEKIKINVTCKAGNRSLALNSFKATFVLNTDTSRELVQEGVAETGFVCNYTAEEFEAVYTHESESITVQNVKGMSALLAKMQQVDANFPDWYSDEFLAPQFIHSKDIPGKNIPRKKYNINMGIGMTFNGKIAMEIGGTSSYRQAVASGLDPEETLYVIATNCIANLESASSSETFTF